MEEITESIIREMAEKLAGEFKPEKIILFGSPARGRAGDSSDVDFLIIMESELPPPKRSAPMYSLLRDYPYSKEILVRTRAEIRRFASIPFSFLQTAIREGRVLYDAKSATRSGLAD